jgi:glutathione S-transferase
LASKTGSRSSRRNGHTPGAPRPCRIATPIARIPALVTEEGERLTESSLICEYLNDELGDHRLCPESGRERWHILSVVSVVPSGIMECQVMRRAEMLRKRDASQNKQ